MPAVRVSQNCPQNVSARVWGWGLGKLSRRVDCMGRGQPGRVLLCGWGRLARRWGVQCPPPDTLSWLLLPPPRVPRTSPPPGAPFEKWDRTLFLPFYPLHCPSQEMGTSTLFPSAGQQMNQSVARLGGDRLALQPICRTTKKMLLRVEFQSGVRTHHWR